MIRFSPPDEIYAELFDAVQSSQLLADSKSFVDATPKSNPAAILKAYRQIHQENGFELEAFVTANFDLPDSPTKSQAPSGRRPIRQQIDGLWDILTRAADDNSKHSSLIALPRPYIVPGGRFREIFYWDSYFTMLGLAASGKFDLIEHMVENFAFLIGEIGFIPTGNRTYFCTRSQPPYFVLMVELLAEVRRDMRIVGKYLPQLAKEYAFWMSGADQLDDELSATRRVIAVDGGYLNRHWDDSDLPRQESHAEDLALAAKSGRDPSGLYRDIRAACESGWDFGSRWLEDGHSMESIRTTHIVPIDLNSILFRLETVLAKGFKAQGNTAQAAFFDGRAQNRKRLIQSLFFDERQGFFTDLSLPHLTPSEAHSLAGACPLFFELATPDQARKVVDTIRAEYLKPGGWVTTPYNTGQQWDAPNGWAPLQWIVYVGMCHYGFATQARRDAARWVDNVRSVYESSGKLLEKYNVEEIGIFAEGGEYAVQDGFGWTNGVFLAFLDELDAE